MVNNRILRLRRPPRGFTMIEMLVVLSIIMLLVGLAAPAHFKRVQVAKEVVLMQNLATLRKSIDQFHADRGRFPVSIDELVDLRYLNGKPIDPITGSSETWVGLPPSAEDLDTQGIADIKSTAEGQTDAGVLYAAL